MEPFGVKFNFVGEQFLNCAESSADAATEDRPRPSESEEKENARQSLKKATREETQPEVEPKDLTLPLIPLSASLRKAPVRLLSWILCCEFPEQPWLCC